MLKLLKLLVITNLILNSTLAVYNESNQRNDNVDNDSVELPDFEFTDDKNVEQPTNDYYDEDQNGQDDDAPEVSSPSDSPPTDDLLDVNMNGDEDEGFGVESENDGLNFNVNFDDEDELEDFNTKEEKLKKVLLKAMSHTDMKRKFAEVLPLLRVMSKQQRATLASLITAQVNAKSGRELTLDQVNKMFGNRPDLILPLILDIANLIRTAALKDKESSKSSDKYSEHEKLPTVQLLRRSFKVERPMERRTGTATDEDEDVEDDEAIGVINQHAVHRAADDESVEEDGNVGVGVIEEQSQQQAAASAVRNQRDHNIDRSERRAAVVSIDVAAPVNNLKDDRIEEVDEEPKIIENESQSRSLASNLQPVFEKLVQSLPSSFHLHQQQLHTAKKLRNRLHQPMQSQHSHQSAADDTMTYHESKLNMTAFNGTQKDQIAMPSDGPIPVTLPRSDTPLYNGMNGNRNLTMEEIEDLALSSLNGTEFADDVAHEGSQPHMLGGAPVNNSLLPTAEMLIGGRYRKGYGYHKNKIDDSCDTFAGGICLRVENYPIDQIMGSIRRHKHAMAALLAEYRDKISELDNNDYLEELEYSNKRKREDTSATAAPGGMCPSIIRYARPQKARSASGDWKYIVNTGHHTQTLRLEKCSNPQDSCTYLTDNFRSRCIQIYNYHRLLSWDSGRGLHVDIFKVPTCCSCHIDGYRETFPPLTSSVPSYHEYNDDYTQSASTLKHNTNSHYSTLNLEDLEEDEEPDDSIAYQYGNGFKLTTTKHNKYEHILQQSPSLKKNRFERPKSSKHPTYIPTPILDTYLSPPPNDFHSSYQFKRGPQMTAVETAPPTRIRRPLRKSTTLDDQSSSGSDRRASLVTVLPPSPHEFSTSRISSKRPSIKPQPTTTKKPNTRLLELGKRVNYNYHPIIDFFEEENNGRHVESIDRIGLNTDHTRSNNWKPLLNRPKQQ